MSEAPDGQYLSQEEIDARGLKLSAGLNITTREADAVLSAKKGYSTTAVFSEGVRINVEKSDRAFLDEYRALVEEGIAA